MNMHDGEVHIDAELVGRLVSTQFPQLADMPTIAIRSTGTVNAIYRIGDHLYARLARVQKWAQDLDNEWQWLSRLAPRLSLRVPEPVGKGHPTSSCPFSWAIYGWIDGQPYADELVDDEDQVAKDLARFVVALRRIDPVVSGHPAAGASHCASSTPTLASPLSRRGASSTAMRSPQPGSAHVKHGVGRNTGVDTQTCSGPTCSFAAAGYARSSTSAVSGSVIPPLTVPGRQAPR